MLTREKPVHWFECQLHSNDLVLIEVFRERDGKISGPLGKAASDPVHRLSPSKFHPVSGPELALPDSDYGNTLTRPNCSHSSQLYYGNRHAITFYLSCLL